MERRLLQFDVRSLRPVEVAIQPAHRIARPVGVPLDPPGRRVEGADQGFAENGEQQSAALQASRPCRAIRKAVLAACILGVCVLAALSRTLKGEEGLHETVEAVGLAMIGICIVGRAWCSLYIGGRKKAEIVDRGPYSISRNPLYVFSFIGAFGMGPFMGPPVLVDETTGVALSQMPAVLFYLGDTLGLLPDTPRLARPDAQGGQRRQ